MFMMNRYQWAKRLLAPAAVLALVVAAQPAALHAEGTPSGAPTLISLTGQISAVNGPAITLAVDAPPRRYTVYLTPHTTYWQRLTAATANDVTVGAGVQVWALARPDGSYAAVKMYFKVILVMGIVQRTGLRTITLRDVTIAGHHHRSLTCSYGASSGFYEGPSVVSADQLLTQMHVTVVGYIHRDDMMDIAQAWIAGVTVAGSVVVHDPLSLTIATARQQRVVLYLTTDTLIWRDHTPLSPAMVGLGSKLQAYGYLEPDNSLHTINIHLVPVSFTGTLRFTSGTLLLDVGHSQQYEVRLAAGTLISYRHRHAMHRSELRHGSKVTITAFPQAGHTLLVVNCVVWAVPAATVHTRRR